MRPYLWGGGGCAVSLILNSLAGFYGLAMFILMNFDHPMPGRAGWFFLLALGGLLVLNLVVIRLSAARSKPLAQGWALGIPAALVGAPLMIGLIHFLS